MFILGFVVENKKDAKKKKKNGHKRKKIKGVFGI